MKLLLVILSAVMSWFVTSKNAVSCEDSYPPYVDVSYTCTYQKGDVRAKDTATISFANLAGMTIERIEVFVKSNKSAGAGEFVVVANGQTVAAKTGSFMDWTGAYDNTSYHAVELLTKPIHGVNELSVALVGTINSLHIEKYVIAFTETASKTVTLMNGNDNYMTLKESFPGAGVEIPYLPDLSTWTFEAWSSAEFWETNQVSYSELVYPGTKYFPSEDITLWAVYKYDQSPTSTYATDLTTDVYMYENSVSHQALRGVPKDGIMASVTANLHDEQQHYRIVFLGDTAAYITHEKTNTPVGYSSSAQLVSSASRWNVYHDGEQVLFYATINSKNYVLWPNLVDEFGSVDYAGLVMAEPGPSPIRLRLTALPEHTVVYSCHPEAQALDNVHEDGQSEEKVLMRFGQYELILRNGQKELIVW